MSGDYTYEKPLADVIQENESKKSDLEKAVTQAREEPLEVKEEEEKFYSEAELEAFWISIVNQEPYTERGNKRGLEYELRSITDDQKREIERYMDECNIKLVAHYDAQQARCSLAQIFVRFGKYAPNPKDNLAERLTNLGGIAIPAIDVMLNIKNFSNGYWNPH